MERTPILTQIDRNLRDYFQKNTQSKTEEVSCFNTNKKHLTLFYSTMGTRFFQNNIKQVSDSPTKQMKNRSKISINIRDPIRSAAPNLVSQQNEISTKKINTGKSKFQPMFSQVERTKKKPYLIGKSVKKLVEEDILKMKEQKEEQQFRKHFPAPHPIKNHSQDFLNLIETEELIKTYNRILSKYKTSNITDPNLKLLNLNQFEDLEEVNLDNQLFSILTIFKQIYHQTKSQFISDNLLKYIMKFQKRDEFQRKFKSKANLKIGTNKGERSKSSLQVFRVRPNTALKEDKRFHQVDCDLKKKIVGPKKQVRFRSSVFEGGFNQFREGYRSRLKL